MRRAGRPLRLALGLAVVGLVLAGAPASPTRAAGPTVEVDPAEPVGDQPRTISVRGSGFDPAANGGVGIYLVFGARTAAPDYYQDALLYEAARWVHRGATDTPGQAALRDDGTFETTLAIAPRYTDGHDRPVDCLVVECALITMAAHGAADRTFDTFTSISFAVAPSVAIVPPDAASVAATASLVPIALVAGAIGLLGAGAFAMAVRRRRQALRSSEPRTGRGAGT